VKIVYFLVLSILLSSAFAVEAMPSEHGSITFLQIHKVPDSIESSSQRFFVRLSGDISEDCAASVWYGYLDNDAGRAQYSAVLASSVSGAEIKLEATDTSGCTSGSMLIRNVYTIGY
jgi:hypothetical protein